MEVETVIAGFVGLIIGAGSTWFFEHRTWLRARRLDEYSTLLTAFRSATSNSAHAIQGRLVYTDPDNNPAERAALRELIVTAWTSIDEFLAAHDRVQLVATEDALAKADLLAAYVLSLRKMKPLSDDQNAVEVDLDAFPSINAKGHDAANDFMGVAANDVVHVRVRSGR